MSSYKENKGNHHDAMPVIGILVTNLGTPDAPTTAALRRYLSEFLWDPRIVEIPRLLWWLILHGVILRFRPKSVAHKYQSIWTDEGSPLLVISKRQAKAIQEQLQQQFSGPVTVALGMRYGNPSIQSALEQLRKANVQRVLVLPLYPQYSAATTASTFDAVAKVFKQWRWLPDIRMITHYHDDHGYIDAVAKSIGDHWETKDRSQMLLFSFHGMPKRTHLAGDPYFDQCQHTARLVAERLRIPEHDWRIVFQSRFGKEEWLQPYCDRTLEKLAKAGTKSIDIVCPGFSADCLETLEEIQMLNRGFFLEAGGEQFHYIPALNDRPEHINYLTNLIIKHTQGWSEGDA